jgi:hypothetical protein
MGNADSHSQVNGFQILTIESEDADASRLPSRDQVIDIFFITGPLCPLGVDAHWPVAGSQILTV